MPFGKRQFAGWVRKQVDLANKVQPNRYGFPADTECRGNPFDSIILFYRFLLLCIGAGWQMELKS